MRQIRFLVLASLGLLLAACATVKYSSDYDPQATFEDYKTYDWIAPSEAQRAALERVNPFLERRLQRAVDAELADRGFARSEEGEPDFWVSVYPLVPSREAGPRGRQVARSQPRVSVAVGFGFGHPYWYGYPYFGYRYPYFGYRYPYFGYRYPYFGYPYAGGFGFPYIGLWLPYGGYPGYGWGPGYDGGYYSFGGYAYPVAVSLDGLGPGTLVVDVTDARSDELAWRGWAEGALLEVPSPDRLDEFAGEVVAEILNGFPPPARSR
ncbi:MAG: DUF4136 domain-containing protein [Gemmatimonadota bacterium]|nr:MAG: DUF4136 domain-containing protein [Gemmatimonadota bacterium]